MTYNTPAFSQENIRGIKETGDEGILQNPWVQEGLHFHL